MNTRPCPFETFWVFLKLGVTCFGGPVAHIGYFRDEFVERRKWLDERTFAELLALCQFLPGPTSSQMGLAIGLHRAGWIGALAAWIGFTLPSALIMTAFAYGVLVLGDVEHAGWLKGLRLAAVAVVAQAVWIMASNFCRDGWTVAIALLSAMTVLVWPSGSSQLLVMGVGSFLGWTIYRHCAEKTEPKITSGKLAIPYGSRSGAIMLGIYFALLLGLPALQASTHSVAIATFDSFYRAGSFVFGGGHVVLPLLQAGVVHPGWVSDDRFLAGYGLAQAVPGPLFSFAAYLGAVMNPQPNGWVGALWCLTAIYTPAALLIFGTLPFWESIRSKAFAGAMLKGTNAAVVGLLLAALYHPVWTSAVHGPVELFVAVIAFGLLIFRVLPPWAVVASAAVAGEMLLY